MTGDKPSGSVLVVGGGIAGMQAASDLANAGFKVLLAERDSAIGGRMSMLDKTFPTNDCAMCIISPTLIEVGRHPNIEILTRTELVGLSGEAGDFTARLKRAPRFVDLDACTACGDCEAVCPIQTVNPYNVGTNTRKAIHKRYPQAIPGAYAIDKRGVSPCRDACPAHVRVQGYVALIAQGRYEEAMRVIRRELPFPAVCGRVCPHPCESACRRGEMDDPVAIRNLKRFAADWKRENDARVLPVPEPDIGKQVAIIGAGPSGLSAAWFLRLEGVQVQVYDARPKPGGMLRYGIPRYRLPEGVLDWELSAFDELGISISCNSALGDAFTLTELLETHDAVYLAPGASEAVSLPIEKSDSAQVVTALDLLERAANGTSSLTGASALIVGGGDVAMDAARTARRLLGANARVHLACLESEETLPASKDEYLGALEEGIVFHFGYGVAAIERDASGAMKAVRLKRCTRVFDNDGVFSPAYDDTDTFEVDTQSLVLAIGQRTSRALTSEFDALGLLGNGRLLVDPLTGQTRHNRLFAGGDAERPATVIAAVAAGRRAAESILRSFSDRDLSDDREWTPELAPESDAPQKAKTPRAESHMRAAEKRVHDFEEIEACLDEDTARAEAARCLSCGICAECGLCEDACKPHAIDHGMKHVQEDVRVGAVVLAPGFDPLEAAELGEYGYGRWPNVVTALEFERMLSATGPTTGHLKRPSDGIAPEKVAWIQCVGSRDPRRGHDYCSGVCCMFAAKEAVIASEHMGDGFEATIFFTDRRTPGKGFDAYCERANEQSGLKWVRSRISRIDEDPRSRDLSLRYTDADGRVLRESYDMVVLSTGVRPSEHLNELARVVGIDTDTHGFARTSLFTPVETSRDGVYVCGMWSGPKDIPQSVTEASGAASAAMRRLHEARFSDTVEAAPPPERNVSEEEPRIGVWVCNCGINIGGVVNVPELAAHAATHPDVAFSEGVLFACSQDNQTEIKRIIEERKLNRVVVASCTPRTHEPLFREALKDAGLNPFLFSMANIREHCSWVHRQTPERATAKALQLMDMAIANARMLKPLHLHRQPVVRDALVIGGGLAGLTATLELAEQGFKTVLIEREQTLGGHLSKLHKASDGRRIRPMLDKLIQTVSAHPLVDVYTRARLVEQKGFVGNFESEVEIANGSVSHMSIMHGACIVATGARESVPQSYMYGQDPRVITQLDLEQLLEGDESGAHIGANVVMIQCVGSRDEKRPYCSKVCCSQSIKNAIELKRRDPAREVTILCRDMRSMGLGDSLYTEARHLGVRVVHFEPESSPQVSGDGGDLFVSLLDPRLGELRFAADHVVLAAAIEAQDNRRLAELMKLPLDENGFFMEVHAKLRPVDFAVEGVFMAGLAHGPKPLSETIAQAAAAAAKAAAILSRDYMTVGGQVSQVDPERCVACLSCVRACPYGVPRIDTATGKAVIEAAQCRGCGVCASECPSKAIQLQHVTNRQIAAMLKVLSREVRHE